MSTIALTVPADYGYVLLAAASSLFIQTYHMTLSVKARAAAKQEYPISFADAALANKDPKVYAFNCTQRAQANFTENYTSFLGGLLIAGLRFPITSAVLGVGWVISRFLYASGYSFSGPKGRSLGFLGHTLTDTPLKFLAVYTAYKMSFGQ